MRSVATAVTSKKLLDRDVAQRLHLNAPRLGFQVDATMIELTGSHCLCTSVTNHYWLTIRRCMAAITARGRGTFGASPGPRSEGVEAWLRDAAAAPHGGETLFSLMRRIAQWLEAEKIMDRHSILDPCHSRRHHSRGDRLCDRGSAKVVLAHRCWPTFGHLSGEDGRWNLMPAGCTVSKAQKITFSCDSPRRAFLPASYRSNSKLKEFLPLS